MKRLIGISCFVLFVLSILFGQAAGQIGLPPVGQRDRTQTSIERNEDVLSRKQQEAKMKEKMLERQEFIDELNEKWSVPKKYHEKYAGFLKNDKRGLSRILPDKNCGGGAVVTTAELERCANLPPVKGAGSLYSFRLNELPDYLDVRGIQAAIAESDMHFVDGQLIVGKGFTMDIITELGRINIEDMDSKSPALKFLNKWKEARSGDEFEEQKLLLEEGINQDGYLFSNTVELKADTTYLLRSINYYANRTPPTAVEYLLGFTHTDILVVFQVVGMEDDGSVVLLWKRLKINSAPVLKIK